MEHSRMVEPRLLKGLVEIGHYIGVSRWTIAPWAKQQAFPLGVLPNGQYATSVTLIDSWLLTRGKRYRELLDEARKTRSEEDSPADLPE